jgi:hypothetical protein
LTVDEELAGKCIPLSNFGKAMAELGIAHIKAATPQAKGRIERLWETFQDRLPVELRLLGIHGVKEANEALSSLLRQHNRRYGVPSAEEGEAYRKLEKGVNLDYVFAWRTTRKVGAGGEIAYKNEVYVPKDMASNFETRTTVEVRETFAGELIIWDKGRVVKVRKIERARRSMECCAEKGKSARLPYKPAADHPWRKGHQRGRRVTEAGISAV